MLVETHFHTGTGPPAYLFWVVDLRKELNDNQMIIVYGTLNWIQGEMGAPKCVQRQEPKARVFDNTAAAFWGKHRGMVTFLPKATKRPWGFEAQQSPWLLPTFWENHC